MTKPVETNCNNCGGERNAFVRASHSTGGDTGHVVWSTTMEILECCGCKDLSIRSESWSDPDGTEITYWPPKQYHKPDWHDRLPDNDLRQAMQEVYVASNQGLVMLASIGVRTLLDQAFFLLLLKEDHGAFANKLKVMVEKGFLLEKEKKIFQIIADVGNAAAHRAHLPTQETLTKILTAVESFLYQKFILPGDAKAMEKDTPSRGS